MTVCVCSCQWRHCCTSTCNTWFPALRCCCRIRSRIRFRSRFLKNRIRTCRSVCALLVGRVRGTSAAGPEAGRRVSRTKEWAELQARTNSRYGKIELDPIWTDQRLRRTNGNGERYFSRKLRILTEFIRMNVILTYFATETATATATATDTERWKSGITYFATETDMGTDTWRWKSA